MIDVKNPNNRINIIKGVRKKIIDIFNENNKNQVTSVSKKGFYQQRIHQRFKKQSINSNC